jgi:hypothetical protein
MIFVLAFFAVFTLAIGSALLKRKLNPYGDVSYAGLPEELRAELERVLPDFHHERARITKRGDEARLSGKYLGEPMSVEADFDPSGSLVEFEAEVHVSKRMSGTVAPEALPAAASQEVDRVLGPARPQFEPSRVLTGTSRGQDHFEVKGRAGDWKWEIAVSAEGQLLEVDKERRRR